MNPTAYCYAKGLPTSNKPTADPYKWTNEMVSRILERVDYLGHTVNFKTTKQSYKSKKKNLEMTLRNWVIFENTQPPIIEGKRVPDCSEHSQGASPSYQDG